MKYNFSIIRRTLEKLDFIIMKTFIFQIIDFFLIIYNFSIYFFKITVSIDILIDTFLHLTFL